MPQSVVEKAKEALEFLKGQYALAPQVGIVLGSGLGNFVDHIKIEREVSYKDIPHFPVSTVKGHSGKLIFGEISGKKIVAMSGRFHFYEGYSSQEVTFPKHESFCTRHVFQR